VRPLAIIGIVLGSSVAITLGLLVVLFIYLLIGADEPAIRREIPALWRNTGIFLVLTAIAAAAFYAQLVQKTWRWAALAALVLAITATGIYYWP
jgi:hypothetical protein